MQIDIVCPTLHQNCHIANYIKTLRNTKSWRDDPVPHNREHTVGQDQQFLNEVIRATIMHDTVQMIW